MNFCEKTAAFLRLWIVEIIFSLHYSKARYLLCCALSIHRASIASVAEKCLVDIDNMGFILKLFADFHDASFYFIITQK